ncbi:putative aldo-keto reductase 1 [Quercus suber]|uniref:Aldo-keto reductase 1 n=1 Tax=Quercus suber TaxID=58331 RepID=A0AAW0K3E7_QUESU
MLCIPSQLYKWSGLADWTRDIEEEIIPLCRFVQFTYDAFKKLSLECFHGAWDWNSSVQSPRSWIFFFAGKGVVEILAANSLLIHISPIFCVIYLLDFQMVKLTEEDLKEISDIVTIEEVVTGGISFQNMDHFHWKFANTPPKN